SPAIAIAVGVSLKSYRKKRNPKFPPGAMGWPLVGSTFSFFKPHPPSSLGDFMEQHLSRYGKVFSMSFLGEMVVVSADAELNRYVLQNEMRLFRNSLPAHFRKLIGDFSMAMLMGDAYRHKKAVLLAFLNKARLQGGFVRGVERLADTLTASWTDRGVIFAREEANKFSFYVIAKKAMGLTPEDSEAEQLRRDYMTLYKGIHALPINLPGSTHREALKARANIVKTIKKKLDERKARGSGDEEDDLLGCLIEEGTYDWENICDTVQGFIFAGLVTSSTVMSLAMYFLENCPKALEQMREEHLECMRSKKQNGDGKLTWDDYRNMEFTQNVISETLRLGNVVGNLWKKAMKDVEFKGYFIPEGTTVITHLAAVHLDPSVFENPGQFNPWRWSAKDVKKGNNLLPFGGGVRHCMGSELARVEISVFLHYLILNYNWESVEPDQPVSFPQVTFLKDLPIRVRAAHYGL
ncbi:Cytochrome P450 90B1, partial [Ananas comosus]